MNLYLHLNFGGNCEEAFRFYEQHLGGRILVMVNQSQVPGTAAGSGTAIIHARMSIGNTVLIGNDVPPSSFQPIRSVYVFLSLDSVEEIAIMVRRFLDQLSSGHPILPKATFIDGASRLARARELAGHLDKYVV